MVTTFRTHWQSVTCLFALAGCAGSHASSYEALSEAYRATGPRPVEAQSRDERALTRAPLERAALVRAVLDRNPSLEAARQAWRGALARVRQAGAVEDPMAMVAVAPLSITSGEARFGYEIGLSQKLPLGGKRDAEASLALAQAEAKGADLQSTRLALGLQTVMLYEDYCAATRSLGLLDEHARLLRSLDQTVAAGFSSGQSGTDDALDLESELAKNEYERGSLETERALIVTQLNALLHRDAGAPLAEPPAQDADASAPARDDARELALRPDLAAAQARVRAANAMGEVADSDFLPEITLSASYSSMWDMPEHRFMLGASVSIPLERTRRNAAVEEASAEQGMSQSEALDMLDAARSEVGVAQLRARRALAASTLQAQRLVPLALRRVESTRARFSASQATLRDVIGAERALRDARLMLLEARAEVARRTAELDMARGYVPGLVGKEAAP